MLEYYTAVPWGHKLPFVLGIIARMVDSFGTKYVNYNLSYVFLFYLQD